MGTGTEGWEESCAVEVMQAVSGEEGLTVMLSYS